MNAKKIILSIAGAVSVLMLLYPPTVLFIRETPEHPASFHFEYMFIFSIPEDVRINGIVLLSQWFCLLLIVGIVMSYFPSSDPARVNRQSREDKPEDAAGDDNFPGSKTEKEADS